MRSSAAAARALLVTALLVPAAVAAQEQGTAQQPTADDVALRNYQLTMDNLRKLKATMLEMKAWDQAHPGSAPSAWSGDISVPHQTIVQRVAALDSLPQLHSALTDAGLTTRDYVLSTLTYLQAQIVASMPGQPVPFNVNPANVAFIQQHQAELKELDLQGAAPGGG